MRPSCPPAVALLVLLASGCVREGGALPASGPAPAPIAQAAPGRAASSEPSPPRAEPSPRDEPTPRAEPTAAEAPPTRAPAVVDASPSSAPAPAPAPKADRLELTFVGDIIFGRYRDAGFVPLAADPRFDYFAEIRSTLAADVVVGNLETPVVEVLPAASPIDTPHRFGASRQLVRDHLRGFTILGLANNHALDLAEDGLRQSPRILAEEGIVPIGAARTEAPLHRVEVSWPATGQVQVFEGVGRDQRLVVYE